MTMTLDRRLFLGGTGAALGALPARAGAAPSSPSGRGPVPRPTPDAGPLGDGYTHVCDIERDGVGWAVWEDQSRREGPLVFQSAAGRLVLGKRLEAAFAEAQPPYLGLALKDIARADADLLADALLAHGGDPDPQRVRAAAPPPGSDFKPADLGARFPWTTFVGSKQAGDTMPVFNNGNTRTYRPEHDFPDLRVHDAGKTGGGKTGGGKTRWEGMLGGWLPVVHRVIQVSDTRHYDLLVFGDVLARDPLVVQTWHRTQAYERGRLVETVYGHSYTPFPPRREPPTASAFFAALLTCAAFWQAEVDDMARLASPDPSWADMARHAFVRELVTRPQGRYPKYGAVDRDYYGSEYDGFQDTFTSSLYANLEWGRFDQARIVLEEFFDDFVSDDGMINMRGPEVPQFGLTLSLLARYLRYTGDAATLRRLVPKIRATADILVELHDAALALDPADPGHGLLHGWSESDACLHHQPDLWWKPYWNNSAFAVRGWVDLAAVWTVIDPRGASYADALASRAATLRRTLVARLRGSVRHDLRPPYVGIMPGLPGTFRQAMARAEAEGGDTQEGWAHRAYAELLHADVLPDDLSHLVVDCLRGHGGTTIGVVANIVPANDSDREQLGFISYGHAQALLRLDRIEEYLLFLYSHRYHSHLPGSWIAAETAGIDGSLPLYCVPAQLTIPKLLRWMMVYEENEADRLHLLRAVPRAWLAAGTPIGLSGAPTRWGKVDVSLTLDLEAGRGQGQVRCAGAARPGQTHLRLRLPQGQRLAGGTVAGAPLAVGGREKDTLVIPAALFPPQADAMLTVDIRLSRV